MINATGAENITKEMIQFYLKVGRCLILLDALDEVPKDVRNELHKKIVTFLLSSNPSNKICITSRSRGFIPQKEIEVIEIFPLIEKDIADYLDKMIELKKFKKSDKDMFMEQAKVLIDKEFLNNFLVLSLLVNIYKAEKALPENKIDLYKKCFEYIAKKREEEKSKTGFNWSKIYPLMKDSTFISLAVLAAPNNKDIPRSEIESRLLRQYKTKYSDEAAAEQAIGEFLEFCSNRTELFVPASVDDKYKFFHRSFFEYFYARFIYQQPQVKVMYNLMSQFDIDSEVFELVVALVKEDQEEKYQDLINLIFEKAENEILNRNVQATAFMILTLAMQVIDDAYYIGQYYKFLIRHSQSLADSDSLHLNHRLMAIWVKSAVEGNMERHAEFSRTYKKYCLRFILNMLSIPTSNKFKIDYTSFAERFIVSPINPIFKRFSQIEIPFYFALFQNAGELLAFTEKELAIPFHQLSCIDTYATKRQQKTLLQGYNYYHKMTEEEKNIFLKAFKIEKV